MDETNLASAGTDLRKREGIPEKNEEKHIGTWSLGQPSLKLIPSLSEWAVARCVAHFVWANLPPNFNGTKTTPSAEQVVQYLYGLTAASAKLPIAMFVSRRSKLILHAVAVLKQRSNGRHPM